MLSRFRRIFVFRVSFSKFGSRVIHVRLFLRFAIPSKQEIIEGGTRDIVLFKSSDD